MREISIFQRRLQVQGLFIQRERGKPQISSPNLTDSVSLSTNPDKIPAKKPELIPFYDEFARIRSQPFRSSGSSQKNLSLSLFKGLLYKLWKDVREGNQEAVLEDMNRWVRAIWTHGGINLIAAHRSSSEFEFHMKETAVWKGRLVDLEFHLECNRMDATFSLSNGAKGFPKRSLWAYKKYSPKESISVFQKMGNGY